MLVAIYVGLAFVVGLLGWNRPLGIFGHFILALIFTPIIMLIYHILARMAANRRRRKIVERAIWLEMEARVAAQNTRQR